MSTKDQMLVSVNRFTLPPDVITCRIFKFFAIIFATKESLVLFELVLVFELVHNKDFTHNILTFVTDTASG